ncbi:MAG TPA: class I SAM-dependent methyltransferase [Ferruginibacter sp.]|nr:class I SAM-dependent methyltransferase [Ferruginibacter sp.]
MSLIKIIKKLLPDSLIYMLKKNRQKAIWKKYDQLSTKDVFTKIYSENVWGKDQTDPGSFFSGGGSHDPAQIEPYIAAVNKFISTLGSKPDVMDIGCGDFNIGAQIRSACNRYIAGDIVDGLIAQNRIKFNNANVDFRVFDLTNEACEKVDIIFVRQVLQHLSNDDIQKGLKNIIPYCKYLVLTEHCPEKENFKKNLDKPTGPDIRALFNSGLDITAPPFNYNLPCECICEVPDAVGSIKTYVYRCS